MTSDLTHSQTWKQNYAFLKHFLEKDNWKSSTEEDYPF